MPIPTYTPGYPPDGSSLGQTKSTIRNNLDGTFETLGVDHVNNNGSPGSKPAGYHTLIHQVTQTNVSTIAPPNAVGQLFTGVPGTLVVDGVGTVGIPGDGDTQLYSLSAAGVLSQLTGRSAASSGFAWVGGILIQWGTGTAKSGGNPVPFTVGFPNNVFSVTCSVFNSGASPRVVSIVGTASTTGFTAISTNSTNDIYYIAIGN